MPNTRARRAIAAGAFAALTLLAGCGTGNGGGNEKDATSPTATASAADFNQQDVTFATDMISHHRQAIEMAAMAKDRKASPDVAGLAGKIQAAQQPEIDTMTGWLESWGKPVPEEGTMQHDAGETMPGKMTNEQLESIEDAEGPAFDKQFLQLMIEHHEGAITMAETEQAGGQNGDATALADRVIADQTAEIATMRKLSRRR